MQRTTDRDHSAAAAVTFIAALLLAAPATAYEVLLDIDLDGDPSTINELTEDQMCTVKIVLAPTEPDEQITFVEFGIGGTCIECDGVFQYGVVQDAGAPYDGDWTDHPDFTGVWGGILSLDCPAPVSYHEVFMAEPVGGAFTLSAPIFLAAFQAEVAAPPGEGCQTPPANLAAMPQQNAWWNYVQIGGPAIGTEASTWSTLKGLFR
jgi:hypothetical protein